MKTKPCLTEQDVEKMMAACRAEAAKHATAREKEYQGPKGPEPTRYGDWEVKGIASDF